MDFSVYVLSPDISLLPMKIKISVEYKDRWIDKVFTDPEEAKDFITIAYGDLQQEETKDFMKDMAEDIHEPFEQGPTEKQELQNRYGI